MSEERKDWGDVIDAAMIAEFASNLHYMDVDAVNRAIRESDDKLADEESWNEALHAWRRKLVAQVVSHE